jgi:hypothetical protein
MLKETHTDFVYHKDNNFKYEDDYDSVMQFIKNNKAIPNKLKEYKNSDEHQNNINKLNEVIKKGNLKEEEKLFKHPEAQLYALYLLQEKKINIADFTTINIYLEALMHAGVQKVRSEDEKYILDKLEVNLVQLDNNIKTMIKDKLQQLWFDEHDFTKFDENEFDERITNLNNLDKNIIRIKKSDNYVSKDYEKFMNTISESSPCVFEDEDYYYIPTTGMTNLILQTINKEQPVKIAPIFGTINLDTLNLMHQCGYHPISLYSQYVKSNPTTVHRVKPGPLPTLLHDLGVHLFWGNQINKTHYLFIYEYLIPKTAEILNLTIDNAIEDIKNNRNWSLYYMIDLAFATYLYSLPDTASNDPNVYLYNSFLHAFSNNAEKGSKLFKAIFADKEFIKKQFNIDLEDVYKNLYLLMAQYISTVRDVNFLKIDLFKELFALRDLIKEKYSFQDILKDILSISDFKNFKKQMCILPECSKVFPLLDLITTEHKSLSISEKIKKNTDKIKKLDINVEKLFEELSALNQEDKLMFNNKLDDTLNILKNIKFSNSSGLYKEETYTTAKDLQKKLEALQETIVKKYYIHRRFD